MKFEDLQIPKCKRYSGYKPCYSYKNCLENGCAEDTDSNKLGVKILIISLDAMGNVLLNTSVLHAIKTKFPVSTIFWITMKNAVKILNNSKFIDKVYSWDDESRMILRNVEFDYLYNADKSDYACAFANEIKSKNKLGFLLNSDGKIIPANNSAMYSYMMGINDQLKFRENKKSGVEIIHEVFELDYQRDEYEFYFNEEESAFIDNYKKEINYDIKYLYVGLNTGCSLLFPNKKMTIEQHITLIKKFLLQENIIIVLLGGREDNERNSEIFNAFDKTDKKRIINTPTTEGLRNGASFMSITDIVITGDSFGLHLAIALRKYVIVWFGLSCSAEIELYGRGEKIIPEGLECSPCWKRECPYNLECISMIDLDKIVKLVKNYFKK
jgi:ADP-heptose:LPS heptosyltransferase